MSVKDVCCVNEENVNIVIEQLPEEDDIVDIAEIFNLLGDPTRMRIMAALCIKELCVGDLSTFMEISQSGVSHQLRLLKKNRVVKSRREGKNIFYSVEDEHIKQLIEIALTHIHEE